MGPRLALTALLFAATLAASDDTWREQGVLHLANSPHARLHSIPVRAVKMGDGFWSARMRANVERSIPTMLTLLEEHGVVDNFRRSSGRKQAPRKGPLYTDSDLYKWIEAAAFVLQSEDRPELRATVDRMIGEILAAQEPSGYLNTWYVGERTKLRFAEMQRGHELYCLGHLLQAAIAYWRATGDRRLLDGGIRFVDYLIRDFGPGKQPLLTGHPEFELAVIELYRITGDRRHLELARYLLSGVERERLKLSDRDVVYLFSGAPFTSRTGFEGHAVRAMYAASGATDYYLETGDGAYWRTLETLWRDLTAGKMYLTGGVGSRAQGEAFGRAYELPNRDAYTESCAAIGNMMFNSRMLASTGQARFADVIERALYNGINSGMSLDGLLYCYRNPLESEGERIRNPWYETTCCPPNIERTLASLPGYLYSTSTEGVWVHLYHNSTLSWRLEDRTPLALRQTTQYPWQGCVSIEVNPERETEFSVFVRIPAWAEHASAKVNGLAAPGRLKPGEYFTVRRAWRKGDAISLSLAMPARLTVAHPMVSENVGRVAVERGPLVYCLEQHELPAGVSLFDVALAAGEGKFQTEHRPDLLGGIWTIGARGAARAQPSPSVPLYQTADRAPARGREFLLKLIPYYAWANRGETAMRVWLPQAAHP
jgi:uncharacterized protein